MATTVVDAIADRTGLVLVAQSFGGFTAPLVCERVPVGLMVLVAAMIPRPHVADLLEFVQTESAVRDSMPGADAVLVTIGLNDLAFNRLDGPMWHRPQLPPDPVERDHARMRGRSHRRAGGTSMPSSSRWGLHPLSPEK